MYYVCHPATLYTGAATVATAPAASANPVPALGSQAVANDALSGLAGLLPSLKKVAALSTSQTADTFAAQNAISSSTVNLLNKVQGVPIRL